MEPKTQQECIKTIRALLNSTKYGLSTNEILNDYAKMEGKPLPFKTFGFNTFDEFLRNSNQFIFNDTKQGYKVTAKTSEDSQHHQQLVQSTKSNRPKKKINLMPNRSLQSSTNDNEWNTTAYAKVYNKLPNRSVKKVAMHPAKLLQATFANSNGNAMPHKKANNINHNNTGS